MRRTPFSTTSSIVVPLQPQGFVARTRHIPLVTQRWAGPKYRVWSESMHSVSAGLVPSSVENNGQR
eukprot:9504130-Pyramimonas_sp.AAC.1